MPPKNRGGRPRYMVSDETRNTVTVLAGNGVSHNAIARALGISTPTLVRYYKTELATANEDLAARMGAALVRQALGGNVNAIKFWLATRGGEGWRIPKDDAEALARATMDSDGEVVHFFMPPNHRDEPDDDEPPIIEGQVEAA